MNAQDRQLIRLGKNIQNASMTNRDIMLIQLIHQMQKSL